MSARAEEFEVGHIPVYRYTSKTAAPDYALILLPGIGGYGGYYPGYCDLHVEKGLEIWAMDPPGHGRSALPRGQFTMEGSIDDVLTLAEHIARTTSLPVFTYGSSLGSGTAFLGCYLADRVGVQAELAGEACRAFAGFGAERRRPRCLLFGRAGLCDIDGIAAFRKPAPGLARIDEDQGIGASEETRESRCECRSLAELVGAVGFQIEGKRQQERRSPPQSREGLEVGGRGGQCA
jgi:pimeloyl-ACP methyl ester carboxylesterase